MTNPQDKAIYTSAACENCDYAGDTGSNSILPFAQEHADFHDHRLMAKGERPFPGRSGIVVSTLAIVPAPRPEGGGRPKSHIQKSSAWTE